MYLCINCIVAETVRQVSTFTPEPKQIKKAIEMLIEREYLKRDENDSNVYMYLA